MVICASSAVCKDIIDAQALVTRGMLCTTATAEISKKNTYVLRNVFKADNREN